MSNKEDVKGAVGGVANEEKTGENQSRKEDGNGDPGRSDGGRQRGRGGRGRGDWKPRGGTRDGGNFVDTSQGHPDGGSNARGGRREGGNDWKPRGARGYYGRGQQNAARYYYGRRSYSNRASDENAVQTRDIVTDGGREANLVSPAPKNTAVAANSGTSTATEDDQPGPSYLVVPLMECRPTAFDDASKKLMNELLTAAEGKTEVDMRTFQEALDVFKVSLRNLAADYCESLEATNRRTKDQIRSDCSTMVRWVKQSLRNVVAASRSEDDPTDPEKLFRAEDK